MEFKGTKGKWEFDIDEYYSHAYVYVQGKGNLCELNYTDENMRETPYNMQLISKAPEMLCQLNDNLLILFNTISYLKNISKLISDNEIQKLESNVKLIEKQIYEIKKLIKEATDVR